MTLVSEAFHQARRALAQRVGGAPTPKFVPSQTVLLE